MENDQDGAGTTGVSRGQNQLHVLPEDWQAAAAVIAPLLDRIDATDTAPQLLVLTSDADAAAGLANRLAFLAGERGIRSLAATDARRATRVQRSSPSQIIIGPPAVLVELLQSATLKLDAVRATVLAWVEDLGGAATRALETFMSEVPKDAARVVLAGAVTPELEQIVERYARRARRQTVQPEAAHPVSLSYLAVGDVARPMALRRILDALDPESAFVVTRTSESRADVEAQLRALGYGGETSSVRVGELPDAAAQLVVLYDVPSTEEQLRAVVATRPSARVVALVPPRSVTTLRRMAGGAVTPFALPEAAARARGREEHFRDEIRAVLAAGHFSRELLALEPLLAEFDGAEVAAAALRLLDAERTRSHPVAGASAPAAMTRVYINVGEMDGVRPSDLVGAITNEAGISKGELGRVEVRERHSTVEVATSVANTVVSKLTGVTIKGRRALVKIDEERGGGPRDGAPRRDGSGSGGRGGRGGPPRDRDRGGPRRDRPTRPARPR